MILRLNILIYVLEILWEGWDGHLLEAGFYTIIQGETLRKSLTIIVEFRDYCHSN